MLAKRLFFVCSGIFLLALAYHFGAQTATAQAPSNPVVATFGSAYPGVVTANGDVYLSETWYGPWTLISNVFFGPTPATQATWGSIKARYLPGASAAPKDK